MRSGQYIKQINGYKAFIPTPLPPTPSLKLDEGLTKTLSQATLLLARLDGLAYTLPNVSLFITMYAKKEALLSSQIEGTQASLENVLEFESGMVPENMQDVEGVVNYVKAMNYGMERLETLPMSLRLIKELHTILLEQTRGKDKTPGEFKRSQNWIGVPGATLNTAAFVPPPPHEAAEAMSQLESYMHESTQYPELIECALIHYQFETIHPFLDGNGRIGRLLITLYLYWKGIVEKPLLYLSYYFKKNRQEYYDRLTMTRNTGNYEQWVEFFLRGVIETSEAAIEDIKSILALQSKDQNLLYEKKMSSPLAMMLLNKLYYSPIITIKDVQAILNISHPTAAHIVAQFVGLGILQAVPGKTRPVRYAYTKYLAILAQGTNPL